MRMSKRHFLEVWVFFVAFPAFLGLSYGGQWSDTGSLNSSRNGHEGAVLTDGRIMVLGGSSDLGGYFYRLEVLPINQDFAILTGDYKATKKLTILR